MDNTIQKNETETETEQWLDEKMKFIQALYSEWLFAADHFDVFWRALVEEVGRSNIFCEGPIEECLRREKLDVKDERCWELLTELRKLIGELYIKSYENQEELEQRIKRSEGYKFDINWGIGSIVKLLREDIRVELPGVKTSVTKGDKGFGCIGSITVRVKNPGPYSDDELWPKIKEIIERYNRIDFCGERHFGFRVERDLK